MVPLAHIQFGPFAVEFPDRIIATILGFLLLAFLIARFGVPPIRAQLADRTARIETAHAEAERHLAEARQIRDEYANRITQIEVEHRARLDEAVREAEAVRAQIIADAQETARAVRRRAEEEIARERTRQRILMRRLLVQITLDAAEQSVNDLKSESSQRLLIADFVARVSGQTVTASAQRQTQTQGGA